MAIRRDFAQILQEKMNFPLEKKVEEVQKTKNYVPIHDHSVSFYTNPYSWTPQKISPFYKKKAKKSSVSAPQFTVQKSTIPLEVEKSFAIEVLSDSEKKSFKTLLSLGARLDKKCFTLKQLKKEYRALVKIHHPDHSGKPESQDTFQELLDAHRKVCKKITILSSEEI